MNYAPKNLLVWDTWYMPVGNQVHVYHLQRRRAGTAVPEVVHDSLGHAVTTDLVDWETRPPAFAPDPANALDDCQPWTGCALWHQGRGYLFYTMRSAANGTRHQHIGLATTTDPDHWQRHPGNPVITPDPRWYANAERPVPGIVDCRDLIVIRAPAGKGWLGFYATRQPGRELPETSVIACVHSRDLVHWEHRPPAFAPNKYACIEVPDVFEMNGLWYLTCLTGNWYGNNGIWTDPNLTAGTLYAVAEKPEGPYTELKDSALIAARTTAPVSCRSVPFEGERYILYTDREREGLSDTGGLSMGSLTTPKVLRTRGDRLYAAYSPRLEKHLLAEPIGPANPPRQRTDEVWGQVWQMPSAAWNWGDTITGSCRTGWGVALLGVKAESFIFEAAVTLESPGAAGLALRLAGHMNGAVAALDARTKSVYYAEAPAFEFVERRQAPIPVGRPLHLRVVNRLEFIEIYVNDELRLTFSRYAGMGGEVGLFVDRCAARFSDVRLRTLNVTRPT